MMGFFEWFITGNNWLAPLVFFLVCSLWGWVAAKGEKGMAAPLIDFLLVIVVGIGGNAWMVYSVYHKYTNHWTTCSKPEAVANFYVFDNERSLCLKPVFGLVPVDNKDVIELNVPTQPTQEKGEWI